MSAREAARLAVLGTDGVAESWRRASPAGRRAIEDWHRIASGFVGDLVCWNMTGRYLQRLGLVSTEHNGVALAFGGGIGGEAVRLSEQGNEVWYCDLPGTSVWKFAEWRSRRHGYGWRFVTEVPDRPALFDCITSFNVFGSLTADGLVETLERMAIALKPGGRLYCAHDWRERPEHPYIHDHTVFWDETIGRLPLTTTFDCRSPGASDKAYLSILTRDSS